MKNFIFSTLAAGFLLVGLSSCNNNKAEFGIPYIVAYTIQQDNLFKPIIWFPVVNGDLYQGSVTKGGTPLSGRQISGYNIYEVNADYEAAYSVSSLNGTYTTAAQSTEGEYFSDMFVFNYSKELGDFEVTDFEYNSGQFTFTVTEPVENATTYGVYYKFVKPDSGTTGSNALWDDFKIDVEAQDTPDQEIKVSFSSSSYLAEYVLVYPAAAYASSGGSLIKLGEPKKLKSGATSFEEDGE
ncbi:MAG: hypothetical protein LUE26_04165 [Alistipes sp.]|nr:hypothetical protein [Alistipes sp.]